jgi:SAM-dependent methyltransferase
MSADDLSMDEELACISKPATADEIDEASYLDANPDVRASGISAREHFETRGLAEGRVQSVNAAKIQSMRAWKLAQVAFLPGLKGEMSRGKAANFLSRDIIAEFAIPDLPPVSAHPYPDPVVRLIRENRDKLFLDVGAGLRDVYYRNVVNTEIYPSLSTDVLCVGEALPFVENQFDFVFCFATLEHTKRPWEVAGEICRVLKPGGTVMIDYPFLQPVHGYPHHYFNATPMGNRSLFERECDIQLLEIGGHQHPMIGLQWALTVFQRGLPDAEARQFEALSIRDVVDGPLDQLLQEPYCRNLHPEMQKVIATGSTLVAVKKPCTMAEATSKPVVTASATVSRPNTFLRPAGEDIAQLRQQNASLLTQIEMLQCSTSWLVTSPLRYVGRMLRGARS